MSTNELPPDLPEPPAWLDEGPPPNEGEPAPARKSKGPDLADLHREDRFPDLLAGVPMKVPPAPEPDPGSAAGLAAAEARSTLDRWTWAAELGGDWLAAAISPTPALLTLPQGEREDRLFLPAAKVALLISPGGRGKSQALAQLALSIATGCPWLGTYPVARPGPVLLCYGEEDEEEAKRRLQRAARALGIAPSVPGEADRQDWQNARRLAARNLAMLPLYGRPASLVSEKGIGPSELAAALRQRLEEPRPGEAEPPQWSAIILDPAARFAGQESETDNAAATRFVEVLEDLTKGPGGPAVILAHHTNKTALAGWTDQGAARGSSALVDGARWVANLDHEPLDPKVDKSGRPEPGHAERMQAARAVLRRELGSQRGDGSFLRLHVTKTNYGLPPEPLQLFNWAGWLMPAGEQEQRALRAAQAAAREKAGKARGPAEEGEGEGGKAKRTAEQDRTAAPDWRDDL